MATDWNGGSTAGSETLPDLECISKREADLTHDKKGMREREESKLTLGLPAWCPAGRRWH